IEAGIGCLSILLGEDPDPTVGSEGITAYSNAIWGEPGEEWTEDQMWLEAIRLMLNHKVKVKKDDLRFLTNLSVPPGRGPRSGPRRSEVAGSRISNYLATSSEARTLIFDLWTSLIRQQHADRLEHAVWISQ